MTEHMLVIEEGDDVFLEENDKLPYKLVKNLGHGYSANVEMVEDVRSGCVYARKVFRIGGTRDDRKRIFENEIKIIRRLAPHRHIIRVFATYVGKREVGLILSPVAEEGDLETFLNDFKETRNPPTHKIRTIENAFGCLATALSFMHQQKIRHKDIKPQNILVHREQVIYTDFGYSLDHSLAGRSTTVGRPDAFTRRFCAPEVSEWEPRNSKSDIFSLGCVFVELLAALDPRIDLPHDVAYHEMIAQVRSCLNLPCIDFFPSWEILTLACLLLNPLPTKRISADIVVAILSGVRERHQLFCEPCGLETLQVRQPFFAHMLQWHRRELAPPSQLEGSQSISSDQPRIQLSPTMMAPKSGNRSNSTTGVRKATRSSPSVTLKGGKVERTRTSKSQNVSRCRSQGHLLENFDFEKGDGGSEGQIDQSDDDCDVAPPGLFNVANSVPKLQL